MRPQFDTVYTLETPEGAALQLRPAGPYARALAWAIDLLIRLTILIAVGMVLAWLGDLGTGVYLLLLFVIEWFYNIAFEVSSGATPGKRRMGLKVVHDNGTPIAWPASLLRNLLRVVDFLPFLYCLGLLWSLFHPQAKRLGDLAAGTLVIYQTDPTDYRLPAILDAIDAQSVPTALDYQTQQAIVGFAERVPHLSDARRIELADLLEPLHGQRGEAAEQTVMAYARWVAGKV